ncbi:MAG: hypothetical protein ACI9CU_002617 [Polaribacter sp.]|jgi:hypothetical protein
MDRILLYYPTIESPQDIWLREAFLYSDKVSTIIPDIDEEHWPKSIRYLYSKGEYSPVIIDSFLKKHKSAYDAFTNQFLEHIDENSAHGGKIRL